MSMLGTKLYLVSTASNGKNNLYIRRGIDDGVSNLAGSLNDAISVPIPIGSPYLCSGCMGTGSNALVVSFWRPLSVEGDSSDVPVSASTSYIWALGGAKGVQNPDDAINAHFPQHTLQGTVALDMTTVAALTEPNGGSMHAANISSGPSTAVYTTSGADFSITATRDPSTNTTSISLQSTASGYIAVGLGSTTMSGANMYICWNNAGTTIVSRRAAVGHVPPSSASSNDATPLSTIQAIAVKLPGAALQCAFTLPATAVSATGPTRFIYAFSATMPNNPSDPASNIAQHAPGAYGPFMLDLTVVGKVTVGQQGAVGNEAMLRFVHGICMFAAWGVFPLVGIFAARFMKARWGHTWYIVHVATMLAGVLLGTLAGLISIELQIPAAQQRLFTTPHGILGTLVSCVLLPLQILLGFVANGLFRTDRARVPWWDQAHWWIGRGTVLAALGNVYLGIRAYGLPLLWTIVFAAWIAMIGMLFGVAQWMLGAVHHVAGKVGREFEMEGGFDARGRVETPERLVVGGWRKGGEGGSVSPRSPLRGYANEDGNTGKVTGWPGGVNTVGGTGRRPSGKGDALAAFQQGVRRGGQLEDAMGVAHNADEGRRRRSPVRAQVGNGWE
ncbi:hypothetical protein BC830DRAFT_1132808 [Chytriomyces sp. MP71]|nr:hypothetical protein BC830DRAFT_1132808 [Chytriomyces sp. MP71]